MKADDLGTPTACPELIEGSGRQQKGKEKSRADAPAVAQGYGVAQQRSQDES